MNPRDAKKGASCPRFGGRGGGGGGWDRVEVRVGSGLGLGRIRSDRVGLGWGGLGSGCQHQQRPATAANSRQRHRHRSTCFHPDFNTRKRMNYTSVHRYAERTYENRRSNTEHRKPKTELTELTETNQQETKTNIQQTAVVVRTHLEMPAVAELSEILLRLRQEVHEPGSDKHASRKHVQNRQQWRSAAVSPA